MVAYYAGFNRLSAAEIDFKALGTVHERSGFSGLAGGVHKS